ncbi:MAG TPA: ABC transporter ATP-binding protein [Polyangiaceae bacterium]|jgi:peptide/nickel transport system ATP-binding protein|nr:ABC transporter ATP-binding protein [Polyangiaceae bacterium]
MSALLEVSGLTTSFPSERGRVPVVDDISFSIAAGEVLALVGESGCGKSVTAFSVLRLIPKPGQIEAGRIVFQGRDLRALSVPEMRGVRGHQIAMIFQEPMTSLNPVVRVGAQVVEAVRLHESVSPAAARDRCLELFKKVGIPDARERLDAFPHQLSGGLKQRVMIAMALATRPKLLIADEPTTALDVTIQAQILQLLRELQRDFGSSILLITHDLGVVNELADRIAVMYAGRIIERGLREEVLSAPRHPYTQGLLRSIPALAQRGQRLTEIPGVVPRPSNWPKGCRFCTRCPRAFEPCPEIVPGETRLSDTHSAHCHAVELEQQS